MRITPAPLRRVLLGLVLATAAPGLAPAAAAQELTPVVGDPIAYRVSLPADGQMEKDRETLYVETDDAIVFVGAVDLVHEQGNELPVSDGEARRIMTNVFMGSDSLLFGLLHHGVREQNVELDDMVTEMRTLGGQRAAYLSGVFYEDGERVRMDMYVTVKDGIAYLLIIGSARGDASSATLAGRIHESFVLADGPPAQSANPAARSGVLRRIEKSR